MGKGHRHAEDAPHRMDQDSRPDRPHWHGRTQYEIPPVTPNGGEMVRLKAVRINISGHSRKRVNFRPQK